MFQLITSHKTHEVSIIKRSRLILFTEVTAPYFDSRREHINTVWAIHRVFEGQGSRYSEWLVIMDVTNAFHLHNFHIKRSER